jgi:hypothetical protein
MVEFAILIPFLFSIVLGSVDFGRVFAQNAAILGASREAARQATYYDQSLATNPDFQTDGSKDTAILCIAQAELGISPCDTSASAKLQLSTDNHDCSITPSSPPPGNVYPASADSGSMIICWAGIGNDGQQHVRITILWTMGLFTPFLQNVVGTPHLHAIVEATKQTP